MWNVNITNAGHTLNPGDREIMEQAYKLKLEEFGYAAVIMQRDDREGQRAGLSYFERGLNAWAFVCNQAWAAAMDAIGRDVDVVFDAEWVNG